MDEDGDEWCDFADFQAQDVEVASDDGGNGNVGTSGSCRASSRDAGASETFDDDFSIFEDGGDGVGGEDNLVHAVRIEEVEVHDECLRGGREHRSSEEQQPHLCSAV